MPRETPCGAGLSHPAFCAAASSTASRFGSLLSSLRRILVGVLARSMRHLVDKALAEKAVLRMVHRAPEADRDMRRAHRVLDPVVRDVISHLVGKTVGGCLIDPVGEPLRQQSWQRSTGWRAAPAKRSASPTPSSPAVKLDHRRRAVEIVADILLARPQELDRLPDRLGDQHRLMNIVLNRTAPAEPAAEHCLVQDDLFRRHLGGSRCGSKAPSPLCVGAHTSTLSGVTCAVQFCGSIVAWAK